MLRLLDRAHQPSDDGWISRQAILSAVPELVADGAGTGRTVGWIDLGEHEGMSRYHFR